MHICFQLIYAKRVFEDAGLVLDGINVIRVVVVDPIVGADSPKTKPKIDETKLFRRQTDRSSAETSSCKSKRVKIYIYRSRCQTRYEQPINPHSQQIFFKGNFLKGIFLIKPHLPESSLNCLDRQTGRLG
jgi:hypothetical protein